MLEDLYTIRLLGPIVSLALIWTWETWFPLIGWSKSRYKHASINLAIAIFNTLLIGIVIGFGTVQICEWTASYKLGLFNQWPLHAGIRLGLTIFLMDGWLYVWHRLNHRIEFLWRFHKMHHIDKEMDVSTATRFHFGELFFSGIIRFGLIMLLGITLFDLIIYELLVLLNTQIHHADISLGKLDRYLRLLFVTPNMHKVHHSEMTTETNSNYGTLFSFWDRLGKSFKQRTDYSSIRYGLKEYEGSRWESLVGMLATPFRKKP